MLKAIKGVSFAALLALTACGGGSGGGETPDNGGGGNGALGSLGPTPDFSDPQALATTSEDVISEAGEAVGKALGNIFGSSGSQGQQTKAINSQTIFPLTVNQTVNGAVSGTAVTTGVISGTFGGEDNVSLNFTGFEVQFDNYSETGNYVIKSGFMNGSGSMTLGGTSNNPLVINLTADLTVGGKVGARLRLTSLSIQGQLIPKEGGNMGVPGGSVSGSLFIDSDSTSRFCTISGDVDSSKEDSGDQVKINCSPQ